MSTVFPFNSTSSYTKDNTTWTWGSNSNITDTNTSNWSIINWQPTPGQNLEPKYISTILGNNKFDTPTILGKANLILLRSVTLANKLADPLKSILTIDDIIHPDTGIQVLALVDLEVRNERISLWLTIDLENNRALQWNNLEIQLDPKEEQFLIKSVLYAVDQIIEELNK